VTKSLPRLLRWKYGITNEGKYSASKGVDFMPLRRLLSRFSMMSSKHLSKSGDSTSPCM